jgi:hypothetical protein
MNKADRERHNALQRARYRRNSKPFLATVIRWRRKHRKSSSNIDGLGGRKIVIDFVKARHIRLTNDLQFCDTFRVRAASDRIMKNYFSVFLAILTLLGLATLTVSAHPGSGIVVDAHGRVYFSELGDIDAHLPGAIWQIDRQGKLTRFREGGAHWLTLDGKRGFAQSDLDRWFKQRVTPVLERVDTPDGALLQSDGQPIAAHRDGSLYYAKGNLELMRLATDGRLTPIAPTLDSKKFGGIKGLAFGPDDTLYVSCPNAILKVGTNGMVSVLIQPIVVPDCDRVFPPDMPEYQSPYLRGLAVDAHGTVYAAATGCRAVVKITANGQTTVVSRAEHPWSPTGVAVNGDEVYVLEYQHQDSARREEWVPRVRKLARDGKVTTLVSMPTAQGRPVTPQQRP